MSLNEPVTTLIGDLVGSRGSADRSQLQRATEDVLSSVNQRSGPVQPLAPTVGDEFQGAFSNVHTAVCVTLLLRLELLERAGVDSRYGIGQGWVKTLRGQSSRIQDGPGWWSARAAIERAKLWGATSRTSFSRTSIARWEKEPKGSISASEVAALNAFLICRDAMVERLAPRSRRNLLGLLSGCTQAELAKREGVTQSAISQNLRSSGAAAIVAAQESLESSA